jgi:hypothetical protein
LLEQARENLVGNARDLWVAGTENLRRQEKKLDGLSKKLSQHHPNNLHPSLRGALSHAKQSTRSFVKWLDVQAIYLNGPSGVGKENYTWYQQNVHLVPFSWEEEVSLLKRELDRAWSSLVLEEQKNQGLPPMVLAATIGGRPWFFCSSRTKEDQARSSSLLSRETSSSQLKGTRWTFCWYQV